jgi:hypothetical protein
MTPLILALAALGAFVFIAWFAIMCALVVAALSRCSGPCHRCGWVGRLTFFTRRCDECRDEIKLAHADPSPRVRRDESRTATRGPVWAVGASRSGEHLGDEAA